MRFAADATPEPAPPPAPRSDRHLRRLGAGILGGVALAFLIWAATAPLERAAVATGTVAAAASHPVAHPQGGRVAERHVAAGDSVTADARVLTLAAEAERAQVAGVASRLAAARARRARLAAERAGRSRIVQPPPPPGAIPGAGARYARALAAQRDVFARRQEALATELARLDERAQALRVRRRGLTAVIDAQRETLDSLETELAEVRELVAGEVLERRRQRQLERQVLDTRGRIGELESQRDQVAVDLADTQRQRAQVRGERRLDVAQAYAQANTDIAELTAQYRARSARLAQRVVRAPASGTVVAGELPEPGAVIPAGEPVARVVAAEAPRVVEARLAPEDVAGVTPGQAADVRLSGYSFRRTPVLDGTVSHVSADAITDPDSGESYYRVRVALPQDALPANVSRLRPGMPAEVMVVTGERTFLDYLLRPLTDALARSFREN